MALTVGKAILNNNMESLGNILWFKSKVYKYELLLTKIMLKGVRHCWRSSTKPEQWD